MPGSGGSSGSGAEQKADVEKSFSSISGIKFFKESGMGLVPVGKINGGKAEGAVQNGKILIQNEDLPISIRNAVAKYSPGNDISGVTTGSRKAQTGYTELELKDGSVTGVMTDKGQYFRATDLTNANIKEQNSTVPMKQKQHYIQGGTNSIGGKTITDDMITKGAKKYGMTEAQYKASIGLK